jgi:metal-responsive CopG/Arc/MetJ family transcriptional regulator
MNSSGTIVFKAGQLKYDLELISQKKGQNLSSLIREALQSFVNKEKQKELKKSNFLSRYRGVEKMNQAEMLEFTKEIKNNSHLKEKNF